MKQKNSRTLVYKISSRRLEINQLSLTDFTLNEAINNDELIALSDNQFFRALRIKKGFEDREEIIKEKKKELKELRKKNEYVEALKKENELNKILFSDAIVCVEMSGTEKEVEKVYDKLYANGFTINDKLYVELIGTTGGVKNKTIIYIRNDLKEWAIKRLDCGRDMNKLFIPSKLQAYKALDFSGSVEVTNTPNIIVVNDVYTEFKDSVIELSIDSEDNPIEKIIDDYDIELCVNDGEGFISPKFEKQWRKDLGEDYQISAFIVRHGFCKGGLLTMDFHRFAREVANKIYIEDAWGDLRNVLDADIVLTTSMLKLWDSYDNMEHYLKCCSENYYNFCVTKITPKELDKQRSLNYQFIQPFDLSDEDINKLLETTINDVKGILGDDWAKKVLFSRGNNLTEDNADGFDYDFIKALMVDERMKNDPFVMNRLHNMIQKKINDAKKGTIDVHGNYSILAGDPYALLQGIFGLEVTGLLSEREIYMDYWNGVSDEVCIFRAPMSSINNIRKMKIHRSDKADNWYQYLKQCCLLNVWDTTTHTLNGADFDGDLAFTTDNEVFLKNIPDSKPIVCIQSSSSKELVTESRVHELNKNGFKNKIGGITNEGAKMFDLCASFEKGSVERNAIEQRIRFIQLYQQMAIDELKGIVSKNMPKNWFSYQKIKPEDNFEQKELDLIELNNRIKVKEKPYFMRYRYKKLDRTLRNYQKQGSLIRSANSKLSSSYERYYPVIDNGGTMNRICRRVEKEFDHISFNNKNTHFDESIMKCGIEYDDSKIARLKKLYKEYQLSLQQYSQENKRNSKEEKSEYNKKREQFKSMFKSRAYEICESSEELCDILIDICYKTNNSKQFVWDICGKQIIENLLNKNDRTIRYVYHDINGDIDYCGLKFKIGEKII